MRGRPRKLPGDVELWRRFNEGATNRRVANEYGVTESTVRHHRKRISQAKDCWICGHPMVGHQPADHETGRFVPVVERCRTCGRLV